MQHQCCVLYQALDLNATPMLHFPGAFASVDTAMAAVAESDLCGVRLSPLITTSMLTRACFMNRVSTILSATALGFGAMFLGEPTASAQAVTGTVQSSGAPIVGARVRLLELDRVVRTGARGEFTFSHVSSGRYTVFVDVLGYAAASDIVHVASGTATVAFDLRPSAVTLAAVVVSSTPVPRAATETYQSTASKSQGEFLNSAGASFAEKISDLPGVTVRLNGSAPARPILRGLGDNEVLVLENGLRMGDLATFDPAHATPIEAIAISQIDVVRGPATILYGPNTIGGVVNVITDIVPLVSDHPISGTAAIEGNTVNSAGAGYIDNVFSSGDHALRVSAGGVHAKNIHIPSGNRVVYGYSGQGLRRPRLGGRDRHC